MKTLTILSLMVASQLASASYEKVYCSNARNTVRLAEGLGENAVIVSRVSKDGEIRKIDLTHDEVDVERTPETELFSEHREFCEKGDGMNTWQIITYETVTIRNKDGSEFPQGTLNVSPDRKSIRAHLICDESGNSMKCGRN